MFRDVLPIVSEPCRKLQYSTGEDHMQNVYLK